MKRALPIGVLLAGIFLVWSLQGISGRTGLRRDHYNVVLISVDGLRADHLGLYGHPRDTTPRLRSLLQRYPAVRFEDVQSPSTDPLEAHASLLTSLPGEIHGLGFRRGKVLPDGIWTLAQELEVFGYRTAAFVDGGALDPGSGLERGYEVYRVVPRKEAAGARGYDALKRKVYEANRWIAGLGRQERFLLFFHTSLATLPFAPPHPWSVRFDPDYTDFRSRAVTREWLERLRARARPPDPAVVRHVVAQYDGEIAGLDPVLADWLGRLLSPGVHGRDTIFVLVSTNGMELFEHGGVGQAGSGLFDSSLRVPLLLWLPRGGEGGGHGEVVRSQVRLVDVLPTLWALLGLPESRPMEGTSLVSRILGGEGSPLPAFAETLLPTLTVRSVRIPPYRLILDPRLGKGVLFDVVRDPANTLNLAAEHPDALEDLERRLRAREGDIEALRGVLSR